MLSRRAATKVSSGALLVQRRFDHDRWYGHALELDVHTYKFTGEPPQWLKYRQRTEDEVKFAKTVVPVMDFASTYEALLWDADRLNPNLNRKEFGNEIKLRLEKQSNSVARAQHLINEGTYAQEPRVEDAMIARIVDEEHVQAEMQYVKCIRANELAEDNRLDILPGGSAQSLREKTRWAVNTELHPLDRAEIASRLTAWLPEKYHIVYFDDFQTVAANSSSNRKEMLAIVDDVAKTYEKEAAASGYTEDLKEVIAELKDDVDPTRNITLEAIKNCAQLDQLEAWSHQVHEYNGDERMFAIYARAAEITGNKEHAALVKTMVEWNKKASHL